MPEFSSTAQFEAVVSTASLRRERQKIEEELGGVEVQVAAQTGDTGGGGGNASRDRAMGRRNQSKQIDALTDIRATIAEQPRGEAILDEWEAEHQLSERRNELLRELIDTGGGAGNAPRDRAMGRRNQSKQIDALTDIQATVAEQPRSETLLDEWDAEHQLSETRNELLRDLIDVQEQRNFDQSARGGRGMGIGLGIVGAIGGVLSGVAGAASGLSEVDLSPTDVVSGVTLTAADVVSPVGLGPDDVIASAATLAAGDVVGTTATLSASAVVDSTASVGAGDVVGALATISATDVVADGASVTAADVVAEGATISATHLVDAPAGVVAADVITAAASVTAGDVVSAGATVGAGLLVDSAASIGASDLIGDVPDIAIEDLVNVAAGVAGGGLAGGATAAVESASPDSTDGSMDVGAKEVVGGAASVGGAKVISEALGGAGRAVGGAASLAAGLPAQMAARSFERADEKPPEKQGFLEKQFSQALRQLGEFSGQTQVATAGPAVATAVANRGGSEGQTTDPGRERSGQEVKINHSPTYEVPVKRLERQQRQDMRELEKRIDQLENSIARK